MPAVTHIRTPDQRLRVFVSSTLQELAPERVAAREAISRLHLAPVLFEMGARPHPPRDLYRAYVAQSDVFVGVYGQRYGWVAPAMSISGLEDEYVLSSGKPRLIYVKEASEREPRMAELLDRILNDGAASFRSFKAPDELKELVEVDLAVLLTERFAQVTQPAAAAADLRRAAPPVERGTLVGREKETADLAALLASDDIGLVTLTGPGGSGKTRLAIHVAHAVAANFPDGVYYVPLASIADPGAVQAAIAAALEVPSSGQGESSARLLEFLQGKRALVILDNFEQVIDAAPDIARLLSTCAKIKILVTSRQALRVRGERELPVPPLPVRADQGVAPAVILFENRAREVRPDFRLTPDNTETVAEICRRLDGLPLAIELAASRARVLSPHAMLARLDRTLSLLTGGAKDLPERQRTLRATLEWSYDLLTERERVLFRRLGAFAGGFSLEKVEEVTADSEAIEKLESLVDKSLLARVESSSDTRFGMLETIVEFAREHLAASGEEEAIRRAQARVFMGFCESWTAAMTSTRRREAQTAIAADLDNVRAALTFCVASSATEDTETGFRIATALIDYWYFAAEVKEAQKWLAVLEAKGHRMDEALAVRVEWARGMAQIAQADIRPGVEVLLGCFERLRATSQHHRAGYAALLAGLGLRILGEHASALARLNDAIQEFHALDDSYGEALAHDFLAQAHESRGELELAQKEAEEAVSRFTAIPAPWGVANTWTTMGGIAVKQGDAGRARQLFAEAVALLKEHGDRWGGASAMLSLAATVLRAGEYAEARALFEEALLEWRSVGSAIAVASCLGGIGACAFYEDRKDQAAKLLSLSPDDTDPGVQRIVAGLEKGGVLLADLRQARTALGDAAIRSAGRISIDDGIRLALAGR